LRVIIKLSALLPIKVHFTGDGSQGTSGAGAGVHCKVSVTASFSMLLRAAESLQYDGVAIDNNDSELLALIGALMLKVLSASQADIMAETTLTVFWTDSEYVVKAVEAWCQGLPPPESDHPVTTRLLSGEAGGSSRGGRGATEAHWGLAAEPRQPTQSATEVNTAVNGGPPQC
jgi:ribonuclease HI